MHHSSESDRPMGNFEDEITFQEFISSIAHIIVWVKKRLVQICFFVFLGITACLIWAVRQPPVFVAELTFMLNDDSNSQISGISGVLGQLGLPVSSGKLNIDKLLEFAKSRSRIEAALMSSVEIDGSLDLLANHFIKAFDLGNKWSYKDQKLDAFSFHFNHSSENDELDNFVLKSLCKLIAGEKQDRSDALFSTDYGKTDYIMSFTLKSPSPDLSISFVNSLYDQVSDFYIDKATEKNQLIYSLIVAKKDSISKEITAVAYEIADLKDRGSGSFRNTNDVQISLLEIRLLSLKTAFEEVIRNLERAQFALETNTPLIQILDRPISPLPPLRPSIIKYGILGAILGFLFYLVIVFLLQVLNVLQSNSLSQENM